MQDTVNEGILGTVGEVCWDLITWRPTVLVKKLEYFPKLMGTRWRCLTVRLGNHCMRRTKQERELA